MMRRRTRMRVGWKQIKMFTLKSDWQISERTCVLFFSRPKITCHACIRNQAYCRARDQVAYTACQGRSDKDTLERGESQEYIPFQRSDHPGKGFCLQRRSYFSMTGVLRAELIVAPFASTTLGGGSRQTGGAGAGDGVGEALSSTAWRPSSW